MKNIKLIGLVLIILSLQIANAHEEEVPAGVTPDSFLWGLDKALDNLNLLLTFDKGEKARKGMEIARERLEEIKLMAEENKLDAAEKGKEEQIKVLSKVKGCISGIKDEDATKQIGEEIEIEKELEEHEKEIEEASSNLKIKIEVKGALNEQQKALIESLLISLKNKTAEVKVEIQNKKGKTKIEIKQKTGKSEKEIEAEIEDIEEEKGLAGIKREKAAEEIEDAKEGLAELEKELEEHKAEGHVADEKPITSLTDNAGKRITNAEEAFRQNDFGNAFGQANAAQQLIKNAERILEKTVEKFEEGEGEGEAEEKAEIEVEIEDGKAKIKIEVGDAKSRFTLDTTDKNAIIQEIAERTGLSVDEVTELAEFEEETEDEEEVEVEEKGKKEEKIKDMPENYESPEIEVQGNITEFMYNFLEVAPSGYKWEYQLDRDSTIIKKCLVNAVEKEGPIDNTIYLQIQSSGHPKGYWWTTEQRLPQKQGPNINVKLCLSRLKCPYGKISSTQECIVPR